MKVLEEIRRGNIAIRHSQESSTMPCSSTPHASPKLNQCWAPVFSWWPNSNWSQICFVRRKTWPNSVSARKFSHGQFQIGMGMIDQLLKLSLFYQFIFWIDHRISRKRSVQNVQYNLTQNRTDRELLVKQTSEILDSLIKHDLRQSLCNWWNIQISTGRHQILRQSDKCRLKLTK